MMGAMPRAAATPGDYVIDQGWDGYGAAAHGIWRRLFERQSKVLPGRGCDEFLNGLAVLGVAADGIPDFRRLSDILEPLTGWTIVAVPGLVPDDVFFAHLAARRFPATNWIRQPEQMDYLQEPDVFHDVFGHVPLLANPVFADYMQWYGKRGADALRELALAQLARLYWYTVEFGLIRTRAGLRIYGSGIVSSRGESIYCLSSPCPNRVAFDLPRVMRTDYRIDDFQQTYFVIDDFRALFESTRRDLSALWAAAKKAGDIDPTRLLPMDRLMPLAGTSA